MSNAEKTPLAARTRTARCGHAVPSHPGNAKVPCADCALPFEPSKPKAFTCEGCGIEATASRTGPRQRWCSKRCGDWGRTHPGVSTPPVSTCARCDEPLNRIGQKYCSRWCGEVARGVRLPAPLQTRICALQECAAVFQPISERQRCCCEAHGKTHSHRQYRAAGKEVREPWGDKRRDAYHRRRALKKSATSGEPVRFSEVADRDGWTCGICSELVDRNLSYPDPLSPSLDHVIPLSRGGSHDPSNVQLSHLACNLSKGNRVKGRPLALAG